MKRPLHGSKKKGTRARLSRIGQLQFEKLLPHHSYEQHQTVPVGEKKAGTGKNDYEDKNNNNYDEDKMITVKINAFSQEFFSLR